MLVLSRCIGESVMIDDDIEVIVTAVEGGRVKLGFTAPQEVLIHRKEIWLRTITRRMKDDG